jgi:hypothetical protein
MFSKSVVALAICAGLGLSGCASSSGTPVSDDQISQFVRGRTTEREIIARIGPPTSIERSAHGDQIDTYTYTKVGTSLQTYIPLVGDLVGQADTKTKIVRLTFSHDGVLSDWSVSDSNATINSGLLNQK